MKADITESWNHKIIQSGKDLRRSLVQSPAHTGSDMSSDQVVQGLSILVLKISKI